MKYTSPLPALAIDNVSFSYEEDVVLDDITISVPQNKFLAVIGPNGGGKTTLLRLLLGLLVPKTGTISLFGNTPQEARKCLGYVPQYSTLKSTFPSTVLDMVLMGAAKPSFFGGVWSRDTKAKEKAQYFLHMMGLEKKAQNTLGELSGGQRQRALIARALMGKPEDTHSPFLLLLDEPTASIDPAGKHCFYESLGLLRGSVTIIIVSHEMFVGSDFFDDVVFINKKLTVLPEKRITAESLAYLFGDHQHDCPLGDLLHASGVHHEKGCTHGACSGARE